jgi:hypothetical protein
MSLMTATEVHDAVSQILLPPLNTMSVEDHKLVCRLYVATAAVRWTVYDAVDLLSRGTEHRSLDKFVAGYGAGR